MHSSLLSLGPQYGGARVLPARDCLRLSGVDVCFAATGSCVTGDYVQGRSDINSVLVLTDMDPSVLDKLASMGRRYGKKRLRAPCS